MLAFVDMNRKENKDLILGLYLQTKQKLYIYKHKQMHSIESWIKCSEWTTKFICCEASTILTYLFLIVLFTNFSLIDFYFSFVSHFLLFLLFKRWQVASLRPNVCWLVGLSVCVWNFFQNQNNQKIKRIKFDFLIFRRRASPSWS